MEERRSPSMERQKEWVPLQNHPIFERTTTSNVCATTISTIGIINFNLLTWDGSSRFYILDPDTRLIHRLTVRFGDPGNSYLEAASSTKVLQLDTSNFDRDFQLHNISVNKDGTALLLSGPHGLCIAHPHERVSAKDHDTVCSVSWLSNIFRWKEFTRILQASWHPYSNSHLGILSSDAVFRVFDLSHLEQPEQEYYIQNVEPGRHHSAVSICPVSFSFGGEHLWDVFTVFILFSDGSIYILCPVVPYGSFYSSEAIGEIYKDAHEFGLKSSDPRSLNNSSMAITWLEATFPALADNTIQGDHTVAMNAHPYAPSDASLALQGPLRKICYGEDNSSGQNLECKGRAVNLLYSMIGKDSILVTCWSSGQLQIDALADELQPLWNVSNTPHIRVDSYGQVQRVAMICESNSISTENCKLSINNSNIFQSIWMGYSPPLLRLAIVDLSLSKSALNDLVLSVFTDPLVPERIYCLHGDGIDLIILHVLPFSNQSSGKNDTVSAPSVYPILSACHIEDSTSCPIHGFVTLGDSFGRTWLVSKTSKECVVIGMDIWDASSTLHVRADDKIPDPLDPLKKEIPEIISKDLLIGPKVVLIPQSSTSLRTMSCDSIEGRSALHHYYNLFHENYVEYAHKVYIELKYHGAYLKRIVDEQQARLNEANQTLHKAEEKQMALNDRINRALQSYDQLEERLQSIKNLPATDKKPLSRAEREFKSQLEIYAGLELDALHSSIDSLNARLRRYLQSTKTSVHLNKRTSARSQLPESQLVNLKSSLEKLSLVNGENAKKVKLIDRALKSQGLGK